MVFQVLWRLSPRTKNARHYTVPSAQHSTYISKSTNPYFNLTLEDWLFRHKNPEEPLLLVYRDDPCVVIGRNQNPWKEVNLKALHAMPGIPIIRRRSGGGTVYHDWGNTNFSIHLPRQAFDRYATARVILRAVQSLGIDARINERNDICVGEKKIGSAYKIVNRRAYHHGTMLISSSLDTLGDLLRNNKDTMVTRGVASVRSPVCNLQQFKPDVNHEAFTTAVVREFEKEYHVDSTVQCIEELDAFKNVDYIEKGMRELLSWDWVYGQTPEFTYTIKEAFPWGDVTAEIRSKHGIILSCTLDISGTLFAEPAVQELIRIGHMFEGKRYGAAEGISGVVDTSGPRLDVVDWINEILRT